MNSYNRALLPLSGLLLLVLTGCKTTSVIEPVNTCGCADYFPNSSELVASYANDIISEQIYQASGATFCTGLKLVDIAQADKTAKQNLAKLISVQVDSEEHSKIGSLGYGVEVREYQQNTKLESKLELQGAYIAHRWVDEQTCSIYSSARISSSNAALALESAQQSLHNSSFYLANTEHHLVDRRLLQYFVEQGVGKVSNQELQQRYRVETDVSAVNRVSNKLLTLTLQVKIVDREQNKIIKVLSAKGKGVTYKQLKASELYDKALNDALYELRPSLTELLQP